MIKLFSLKQQKKEEGSRKESGGPTAGANAAQLRIQKGSDGPVLATQGRFCSNLRSLNSILIDIAELSLPKNIAIEFADSNDLLNFRIVVTPDEGYYRAGIFPFQFKIPDNYPYDPPKVRCLKKV